MSSRTTAADLIKKLQALPPDTNIIVSGYEGGYDDVDINPNNTVHLKGNEPMKVIDLREPLREACLERGLKDDSEITAREAVEAWSAWELGSSSWAADIIEFYEKPKEIGFRMTDKERKNYIQKLVDDLNQEMLAAVKVGFMVTPSLNNCDKYGEQHRVAIIDCEISKR